MITANNVQKGTLLFWGSNSPVMGAVNLKIRGFGRSTRKDRVRPIGMLEHVIENSPEVPCMEDRIAISRLKQGDLGGLEFLVNRYQVQAEPQSLRRPTLGHFP